MSDSTESPPHFMIQQSAIEAAEELGEGDSFGYIRGERGVGDSSSSSTLLVLLVLLLLLNMESYLGLQW